MRFIGLSAVVLSLAALAPAAGVGEDTFKAKCVACHGPDGSGDTAMGKNLKLRDLRSADVQKQADAELITLVTNGKKVMPAFGKTLNAAQIRDVVAHVRSIAKK